MLPNCSGRFNTSCEIIRKVASDWLRIEPSAHASQTVLAERPDRACLRPLLAHLLGERHASADGQAGKAAIQHAFAMEIDLTAIGAFQEAELPGRIKPHDRSNRRRFVLLYLSLHSAHTLLQSPA